MSKREYLLRYLLIIKRLQKSHATSKEIVAYLDRQSELHDFDLRISPRTMQRDFNEIRSIFNIDIQYNASQKAYYISDDSYTDVNSRMLEVFEMYNALNVASNLREHIQFEKRHPQGTEHLYGILHAIKNNFVINIEYFKFEDESVIERTLEPLLLKEFKDRWYVVAVDQYDSLIKTYGLDRIRELDITRKKFVVPETFDPDTYYQYCFGIIRPEDQEAEEVILSFDSWQGKYVKSYPLHESQQVLIDDNNETRVSLKLYITYDFELELLQFGDRVKVIKPKSLQDVLTEKYRAALDLYVARRTS